MSDARLKSGHIRVLLPQLNRGSAQIRLIELLLKFIYKFLPTESKMGRH